MKRGMSMRVRSLCLWLRPIALLLLFWLAGCGVPASPATLPATPLPTLTASPSLTATPSPPSPSPSPSPVPPTATPSRPPTSTPRPTATLTRTQPPTLPAETRGALVREMLRTNGGCELPCWWGIVPGKTTIREFLADPRTDYGRSSLCVPTIHVPRDYCLDYSTTEQDGVIESIEVVGDFQWGRTMSERAMQDWWRYSLAQVLTRYGVPSQVWLYFAPPIENGAIPRYGLALGYRQLGFAVSYWGPADVWLEGNEVEAKTCPVFRRMALIRLQLRPSEEYWVTTPGSREEGVFSLQEATGMSLEEFQKTFRDENDRNCLRIPTHWP